MFRVFGALALSVVVAGCALDPPAPLVLIKTVTKTVTIKEPGRTCTVTVRPMTSADFCAAAQRDREHCSQIKSCAEAFYRLTVCGHALLDGGTAVKASGEPNRRGEPDGIPCEKELCGVGRLRTETRSAWWMAETIRKEQAEGKQPFVLPMAPPTKEGCGPT